MLEWGEPAGNVEIACKRPLLASIAEDLLSGGEEAIANALERDSHGPAGIAREAAAMQQQGEDMINAALAINAALGEDATPS